MKLQDKTIVIMAVVLCGTVAVGVIQDADAHITFNIPAPSTVTNYQNKTLVFTVGEVDEPAYSDELHNFELTLRDFNTRHTIPNGFRDTMNQGAGCKANVNSCPQSLWVDAYFFPKGTTPSLNTGLCTSNTAIKTGPADAGYTCAPNAGHTANVKGQVVRAIFGKPGQYQANNQWYSEAGRTVYHIYGKVSYFNDTMIPINVWTDGALIKNATNGQVHIVPASGGFGLSDRTTQFWPPNANQPENMRQAAYVNWNVLDQLRNALLNVVNFANFTATPLR